MELGGKTATGLTVPDDIVAGLNAGKRPGVRVTIGPHTYRTTCADGRAFPCATEQGEPRGGRRAAGDEVDVTIELDTGPREVPLPDDLAWALASTER